MAFDVATATVVVSLAKQIIEGIFRQAEIAKAKGEVTPEQMEAIKSNARIADSIWDMKVEAAKERLVKEGG